MSKEKEGVTEIKSKGELTLKIRVQRAGSTEWEDHGIVKGTVEEKKDG